MHLSRLLLLSLVTSSAVNAYVDDDRTAFFESKIRPVLVKHCYQCHATDARNIRGGLLLDSKEATLDGGESGAAVVPGNPDDSLLISALRHESYEMPPDRKLPDHVIADFENWIRDGAVDPRTGGKTLDRHSIDLEEGSKFWSLQPVVRPEVPTVDGDWCRTDIDHFVAARLNEEGHVPATDATAEQVYRRLCFGLTGRPPQPDAIATFARSWKNNPDDAIAAVVDELLESPQFGERWGRHWLDAVRFAESSGGGRSLMFPHAWRFRDYVIRSFNHDKPFDQLVLEHIAGDLLPHKDDAARDDGIAGAGYLTLGPTNYELQDKELLRMEVVDEQVDTMGRTFLGMTLGCARCHDHKFDPIPTADYYALAGIFRSTKTLLPGNVSSYVTTELKSDVDSAAVTKWDKTSKSLKQQIAALRKQIGPTRFNAKSQVDTGTLPGIVVDDRQAKFEKNWVASTSLMPYTNQGYQHDDGAKAGHRVRFDIPVKDGGRYHVRFAYSASSNRCSKVPVVIRHADGQSVVTIDQRKPANVDGLFQELGVYAFDAQSTATVSVDTKDCGPGVVIIDAVQVLSVTDAEADASNANRQRLTSQLAELESQLKKHEKQKPEIPVAMSVHDEPTTQDWHIHLAGGIRQLGPVVPRGALSVLNVEYEDLQSPFAIEDAQSGRLQLAHWIASPSNPLTSRVFVNRVWQKLIGEGLVRTPDNFGTTGQQPTHPQLLDHLAATFVEDDQWSVKQLIRRIVTSRVYRLASDADAQVDPGNLLLSRGFRRRLEAEVLRDAVLLTSGQFSHSTTGGRTIAKITQYDNGYDHAKHSGGLPAIYVPAFRNSMLDFFTVFDVANPNLVVGQRTVSTLPSQALYLLNSPFMLEQSKLAGAKFLDEVSSQQLTVDDMINEACLRTLGRRATAAEQSALGGFVSQQTTDQQAAWTAVFQALYASIDFRYVD